jgi:hypothetical protein
MSSNTTAAKRKIRGLIPAYRKRKEEEAETGVKTITLKGSRYYLDTHTGLIYEKDAADASFGPLAGIYDFKAKKIATERDVRDEVEHFIGYYFWKWLTESHLVEARVTVSGGVQAAKAKIPWTTIADQMGPTAERIYTILTYLPFDPLPSGDDYFVRFEDDTIIVEFATKKKLMETLKGERDAKVIIAAHLEDMGRLYMFDDAVYFKY